MIRDMCLFLEHRMALLIRSGRLNCSSLKGYVIVVIDLAVIPLVADYMVCQIVATAYDWGSRKRIENKINSWGTDQLANWILTLTLLHTVKANSENDNALSCVWAILTWLICQPFFVMILLWPSRQWKMEASKTTRLPPVLDNAFNKYIKEPFDRWYERAYRNFYENVIIRVAPGQVVGALVFIVYYLWTVSGIPTMLLKAVSLFCLSFTEALPGFIVPVVPVVTPLLPFAVCIREFWRMPIPTMIAMYVFMAGMTYLYDFSYLVHFLITFTINLQITYGKTSAWQRRFVRTFVGVFCTQAISHYFGIVSLWMILGVKRGVDMLYTSIDERIHKKKKNTVFVRGQFQTRYFPRGVAQTQMQFVKERLNVFVFIFVVSTLCTSGQLHPWPTFDFGPDTISTLFCKVDNTTQLECHVKTSFNDPYTSEPGHCDNTSKEWTYCGTLVDTVRWAPAKRHLWHRHMHNRVMAEQIRARPNGNHSYACHR